VINRKIIPLDSINFGPSLDALGQFLVQVSMMASAERGHLKGLNEAFLFEEDPGFKVREKDLPRILRLIDRLIAHPNLQENYLVLENDTHEFQMTQRLKHSRFHRTRFRIISISFQDFENTNHSQEYKIVLRENLNLCDEFTVENFLRWVKNLLIFNFFGA